MPVLAQGAVVKGTSYPHSLEMMSDDERCALGQEYLRRSVAHRHTDARFIDKLPNNFLHAGLIACVLPNAKIIDIRRHPMGCGFSNFKQLFSGGQEFSYSLTNIGRFISDYEELMSYWESVLPDMILRINYEDLVSDLPGQVRRVLEFCDLEFEEACLEFFKTERAIHTPSSQQVRSPINKAAGEHWRNFEQHLAPLKNGLAS